MIAKEECCSAVASLITYAEGCGLLDKLDEVYAINTLLRNLRLDAYAPTDERLPFPACLEMLCDYAAENGFIENTVTQRDLFDTALMGALTPLPSTVIGRFRELYARGSRDATDWFYRFSQDSNYIRRDRTARDLRWTVQSEYGEIEISINLSKPEKDPREIAAAKLRPSSGYPKCQLCIENEGFEGTLSHPARENHRIIPLNICGEAWGFQYSPYVYYNEHCIVLNSRHVPMVIEKSTFEKLFAFVEQFPHYFVGSNADLPIVGGSILTHEHFQGGCHVFPMENAESEWEFTVPGYDGVECSVLKYPMTVLRLRGESSRDLSTLAAHILDVWRGYTDEEAFIYAETEGVAHNTITPIARRRNGKLELDLVLRNNITTEEHPLGVFHPHEELHHIKKENIGLIEVMGLAILPGRLKSEMEELKETLLRGESLRGNDQLAKHADWAEEFMKHRGDWSPETADEIIREEVGKVFVRVLECAGVYKCTPEGRAGLRRFIDLL